MQVLLKIKKTNARIAIVLALILIVAGIFVLPTVSAGVKCDGNCSGCGPEATGDTFECNEGDDGATRTCCWDTNCADVDGGCDSVDYYPTCKNCEWYCEKESCTCTSTTCTDQPGSKWRRNAQPNGRYRTCDGSDDCSPAEGDCASKYINSAPTCSISPATVSGVRGNGGTPFTITVSDADYGDEVRITGFNVKDTAGNLNNCVTLQTVGGGSGLGATVKQGYPDENPQALQNNTFIANPDLMHGIYQNVNGQSLCSGKLTVEISDVKGDDLDTVSYATCSVDISMRNNVPTISAITITDQDSMSALHQTGNLVNGNTLFVGSALESKRASYCSAPLSISALGTCNGNNKVAISTRRNPFIVEYTVTDADGAKDIMQAGLWIQRADKGTDNRVLPLVENGVRNSIQVLYSERENVTVGNQGYFNSKACIGSTCTPNSLIDSPKQIFAGYSLIASYGPLVAANGNVSNSPYQYSSFRKWQQVGFPDCYLTVEGCTAANIPATSLNVANGNETLFENYDWSTAADSSHLLCYKNTSAVAEVRTDSGVCPGDCAACAAKVGATQLGNDQIRFKFKIYLNDRDGSGAGMEAGDYRVFVQASDKMGVPLQNAVGRGDEAWLKFDKIGRICDTGTCGSPEDDFSLYFDPIAPTVTSISPGIPTGLGVDVSMVYSDSGSKIAGESMTYLIREELVDGEPAGRLWMKKSDGITDYNGANEHRTITGSLATTTVTRSGKGIEAGENVVAGSCAYDHAGNMGCASSGIPYVFISSWLKTALGDIYSNTSSSGTAFKNLTIPNTQDFTSPMTAFAPFEFNGNSAATGIVMSGGSIGIAGGKPVGSVDYPLGFSTKSSSSEYYRTTESGKFNMLNFDANMVGNEYERLRAYVLRNCDLMNTNEPTACNAQFTDIVGTADPDHYVKVIKMSGSQTITANIVCRNTSIILVEAGVSLTIKGQVTKATASSGCMFVVGANGTLTIDDVTADAPLGKPFVDRFQAAVVAGPGAKFVVAKGQRGANTKRYDRLEILGFVYSANVAPEFKRILPSVDNKKYPAELILYDANVLDSFRSTLGLYKTVDLVCGTSSHILCGEK